MKAKIYALTVLMFLICTFSGFSIQREVFRPTKFNSITFRTTNDRWSNGFSHNLDDQLTYSLGLGVDFNSFLINFDAQAFTDKPNNQRYDLYRLLLTAPLDFDANLSFEVGAGAVLCGNFGLQWAQNFLHRMMGIYILDLNYPECNRVLPQFVINSSYNFNIKSLFNISPYFYYESIFGFSQDEEVGVKFNSDTLTSFVSYRFMQSFDKDNDALDSWVTKRKGFALGYKINKGQLRAEYFINPFTMQGDGKIEISLLSPYNEGKIKYGFGKMFYFHFFDDKGRKAEHFNFVEVIYDNYYISTQFNTGNSDGSSADNGIYTFGMIIRPLSFVIIKPGLKFIRFLRQSDWENRRSYGFGIDAEFFTQFYKNYTASLICGLQYFSGYGIYPCAGAKISLN